MKIFILVCFVFTSAHLLGQVIFPDDGVIEYYYGMEYYHDNYVIIKIDKVTKKQNLIKYKVEVLDLFKGDLINDVNIIEYDAVDGIHRRRFDQSDTILALIENSTEKIYFGFDEGLPQGRYRIINEYGDVDSFLLNGYKKLILGEYEESKYVFLGTVKSIEETIDTLDIGYNNDFVVNEFKVNLRIEECIKCEDKLSKINIYTLPLSLGGYQFKKGETYLVYAKEDDRINRMKRLRVIKPYTFTVHKKYADKQLKIIDANE